jgi:hypothetical protein
MSSIASVRRPPTKIILDVREIKSIYPSLGSTMGTHFKPSTTIILVDCKSILQQMAKPMIYLITLGPTMIDADPDRVPVSIRTLGLSSPTVRAWDMLIDSIDEVNKDHARTGNSNRLEVKATRRDILMLGFRIARNIGIEKASEAVKVKIRLPSLYGSMEVSVSGLSDDLFQALYLDEYDHSAN